MILSGISMDGVTIRTADDLSREELHTMVWERPLNQVGPELGFDGSRLAKLCDKRQIPYPRPGYWQKKAVGRAPAPTPLLPLQSKDAFTKTTRSTQTALKASVNVGTKSLAQQMTTRTAPSEPTPVVLEAPKGGGLDTLENLHPRIRTWIADHKSEQRERAQENRKRRHDAWSWAKPLLDDLTIRDLHRFRASSALCRAVESAGGRVKEADISGKLTFAIGGRDLECTVKEKMSRPMKRREGEAAKWTAYPDHHNSALISSGLLRAQINTWLPGEQPRWVESPKKPFAILIPAIVETIVASVPRLIEWEQKREQERRRYQEEERRRWELRRLKEVDDNRWNRFRSVAVNWREKQVIDAFILELEARLASDGDQSIGEKTTSQWLSWAKERAAKLDPFAEGLIGLFHHVGQR